MDLTLYGIIGHLLNEDNNEYSNDILGKINYAINNRKYISLYYNDQKGNLPKLRYYGNPRGFRRLIPYCLGERNGVVYLRAFHTYKTNTKRGPFKWKLFKISNIKNLRVLDKWPSFTEKDIPSNANPDGDRQMTSVHNIVNFNAFVSPLERERNKTFDISQGRKKAPTNKSGYIDNNEIGADQKRNVKASTYAKTQPKWAEYEKNINKYNDYEDPTLRKQKFADFDKAEAERDLQNRKGPISNDDMENNDKTMF